MRWFEHINAAYLAILPAALAIGGLIGFYSTLLKNRELKLKIEQLERERIHHQKLIYVPSSTAEIVQFSDKSGIARRVSETTTISTSILAVCLITSVLLVASGSFLGLANLEARRSEIANLRKQKESLEQEVARLRAEKDAMKREAADASRSASEIEPQHLSKDVPVTR